MKKSNEEKICNICKKKILAKDNYVRLTEYKIGREFSTAYYHTECFRERFMDFQKLKEKAHSMMTRAKPLLEQFNNLNKEDLVWH